MKRFLTMACLVVSMLPLAAQETYENAKVATGDLNGTARYVGMGGAMDALGADISTISSNPAGIGLFRKSSISGTLGVVSQDDARNNLGANASHLSFDQIGFVVAMRAEENNFLNFAFNYHKSRNFNQILAATDFLDNASQNKLTYAKQLNGLLFPTDKNGVPNFNDPYIDCNQLDDIYARNLNYDANDNTWYYDPANHYTMDREHWGYIADYEFNISGNLNDRFYLGMTVGIHDVNYRHYSEYTERVLGYGFSEYKLTVADERHIDGAGVDLKLGFIFRPIEASPFRIGLSVATPTWYDLKTANYTFVTDGSLKQDNGESYKFALYTPWKFGLSLGHTIGNNLALGAVYEFADYNTLDTRYTTGDYDVWSGVYYENTESDRVMNAHTRRTLKCVSTLKLGVEYKPVNELAVRFGYNHVSPMFTEGAFKDGTLNSAGSYYSSATDFTNWKATNRLTCGLGYTTGNWNLDLAYQYSAQKGSFMPFMNYVDSEDPSFDNVCNEVEVSNNRHQFLFTVGYRF